MIYLPLIFLQILIIEGGHNANNQSDVIITYDRHSDADRPEPIQTIKPTKKAKKITLMVPEKYITERSDVDFFKKGESEEVRRDVDFIKKAESEEASSSDVVFIPNDRNDELVRNEDYVLRRNSNTDYFGKRTDLMDRDEDRIQTDSPPADVVFFSGRNNANENINPEKHPFDEVKKEIVKLNCKNLDCNSSISSVCGGKIEHKQWRYRLFLNDCFFRKVNCHFKHEENRFHEVPIDKCSTSGIHVVTAPSPYHLLPPELLMKYLQREKPVPFKDTRRTYSGRRSMNKGLAGKPCAHACPATCPELYAPECAVSNAGKRRTFMNHCKLDYHSCVYHTVWYKRPLSECVGGKKAEMQHNRGFVDWMQRVGIVDNKGRLNVH